MMYLFTLPPVIPAGYLLVHNHVRPTRHLGLRGFRAWLESSSGVRQLEFCNCDWAPELGPHFRIKRSDEAEMLA